MPCTCWRSRSLLTTDSNSLRNFVARPSLRKRGNYAGGIRMAISSRKRGNYAGCVRSFLFTTPLPPCYHTKKRFFTFAQLSEAKNLSPTLLFQEGLLHQYLFAALDEETSFRVNNAAAAEVIDYTVGISLGKHTLNCCNNIGNLLVVLNQGNLHSPV